MQDIKLQLGQAIHDLYGLNFEPDLAPSPDNIDSDYSSNAPLKLAKELHKSPMEIAKELAETFISAEGGFRSTTDINVSTPGFLNFTLSDEYLQAAISTLNGDYKSDKYQGQTVICEFSDPNPFKVLHVGHLYTSIVGDSIARLFEYAGAKVIRANFGGDVGLHVAKTMYVLKNKPIDKLTIEDIAKCYIEGTALYEDNAEAHRRITELNKEIYRINSEDLHDSPLAELYWKGRELSYQYFDQFYNSIGVKFDKYYPESTVADLGLAKVKEQLDKGVYEYSNGAVIFNGEKYGLHTRVFINKEGVPTYETKDVGLIFTKWQNYHFDKSVVITGSEQLDYMKVVLKSVEQYAPELVEKTTHLTHGLVKLPGNVKMSSRKGNFLKAVDVLDLVRTALKDEYNSTDETVSLAATKYAFLKYKIGGDIIFDPHESVKMTGNSGPYLLYSCVRAKKILSKKSGNGVENAQRASICDNGSKLASEPLDDRFRSRADEKLAFRIEATPNGRPLVDGRERSGERVRVTTPERDLIKKLLEYHAALDEAVAEMAPHKVANYLYELAQAFSRFYENCEVIGSNQEAERIKLVEKYLNVMTHGLNILGITIPEEM